MEDFSKETFGKILKATGQADGWSLSQSETESFYEHYSKTLIDLSITAAKEVEAYLSLERCRTYEQLAKLIAKREEKNLCEREFEVLLGRLRTRACRGRQKVLKKISQIYQAKKQHSKRHPS